MDTQPTEKKKRTAIFSGRFDVCHVGHMLTIQKLKRQFEKVAVVILDYQERTSTVEDIADIFKTIYANHIPDEIMIIINKVHFARITKEEYFDLLKSNEIEPEDAIYVSGNNEVLEHFDELKLPRMFIERSGDFTATAERKLIKEKKLTLNEYMSRE